MATSVDSLSNHYDTLRVAPTATSNEIAEAFAAQMRVVRIRPDMTVARIAQLSLAYETLRDPAKRRAYDNKLGLDRQVPATPPKPKAAPYVVGAYGPSRVTYVPSASARKQEPVRSNAPAEPRVAAFIAASLREPPPRDPLADPAPAAAPRHEPARPPEAMVFTPSPEAAMPSIDRHVASIAAGVVGLGALALAVSLPMTNADSLTTSAAPAQQGVTVGLPPATPVQDYVVPSQAAPVAAAAEQRAEPKSTPVKTETQAALETSPDKNSAEQATTETPPVQIAARQAPAVKTATASPEPAPAVTDAKMPLPNATIARTIERIGYSCGTVSNIVADAGPGAFKVICSSGDSYRAAPIGGRYHFHRLGNR
jgi:hypothetical protein